MPRKPLKPCRYPGCPELTREYYCPAHKRKKAQEYERYRRDPETAKRYDRAWRRVRAAYVKEHPLCEQCKKEGRLTPVEHVHHIRPLKDGGTNDFENLISLCLACHNKLEPRG